MKSTRLPASSAFCALAIALSCAPAAAQSVTLPPLSTWTVVHDPSEVVVSQSNSQIVCQPIQAAPHYVVSPVVALTTFQVAQGGSHLLDLNTVFAVAGSREDVTWRLLPSGDSGTWRQDDSGTTNMDVPQFRVSLRQGVNLLMLESNIYQAGGIGRIYPAQLTAERAPFLVPGHTENFQSPPAPTAEFSLWSTASHAPNHVFLIFASGALLPTPVSQPFGTIELDNPVFVGLSNSPHWAPQSPTEAGIAYSMLTTGTWWQVAEFDAMDPLNTLRLGSATFTAKP